MPYSVIDGIALWLANWIAALFVLQDAANEHHEERIITVNMP